MKEFVEKLIEWLEEISVRKSEEGIINGCNMGICEDDDCLKCLKKKLISNINKLAEEYSKTGNCMNDCEHYDSLANYIYSKGYNTAIDDVREKLLGNGFIFTEHAMNVFDEMAEQLKSKTKL